MGRTWVLPEAFRVDKWVSREPPIYATRVEGAMVAFLYFQKRESQKNEEGAKRPNPEKG